MELARTSPSSFSSSAFSASVLPRTLSRRDATGVFGRCKRQINENAADIRQNENLCVVHSSLGQRQAGGRMCKVVGWGGADSIRFRKPRKAA